MPHLLLSLLLLKLQIPEGSWLETLIDWLPALSLVVGTLLVFVLLRWGLNRKRRFFREYRIYLQIFQFLVPVFGLIVFVIVAPWPDATEEQLMKLIIIVISAVVALGSATTIGNILAGSMLRLVNNFRPGDYIEVGNIYGSITERGMFHTEVQTIDSDLITLPNIYLATNPVKVKQMQNGTIISATISLGYETSHEKVIQLLIQAAEKTNLESPFCHITSLGDFSVSYEIFGLLHEVRHVISTRSKLRGNMLTTLHEAGVEIVSPTFMNQRQVNDQVFIPKKSRKTKEKEPEKEEMPEDIIFKKAEMAGSLEEKKEKLKEFSDHLKTLQGRLKEEKDQKKKDALKAAIDRTNNWSAKLNEKIEEMEAELKKK